MCHSLVFSIVAVIKQPAMLPETSIGLDSIDLDTRFDNHLCIDPSVRLGNESGVGGQQSDVDANFGYVEYISAR